MDLNRHSSSTSNFKRNLIMLCKILFVFIFVAAFCLYLMPQYSESYNAALLDKVARLKELDEPKIVLLGDSNLAFGINSAMIEQELGMPVVNMGLHGGCGNAFHENMAKINVQQGDIYVLCHSYFADGWITSPKVMWMTIEDHFELWKLLRLEDIPIMVKSYPAYLKRCVNSWANENGSLSEDDAYTRSAFNKYGDVEVERNESNITVTDGYRPELDDVTANRVNELNDYLHERGATLLIAGYPIATGEFSVNEEEVAQFQNQLEERTECEVISDFRDYMYEYSFFYDTPVHLTTEGANMRTEQLISDLKAYMNR